MSEDPIGYKRRIGYVPEEPYLYTHLTATEYLTLVGRLRGLPEAALDDKIVRLLRLFQLHDSRYSTMAAYSKGMRQRVLLAAALMHNPDLLVLDEPFSGLDVNAGLLFRALLGLLAADGRMILFSTHRFDMVEKLCSRVVILSSGRLVAEQEIVKAAGPGLAVARRDVLPRDEATGLHAGRQGDHRHHPDAMTGPSSLRDRPWHRLTKHFFVGLFDFGVLSEAGSDAFQRLLIGIVAVILTFGLLLTRMYMGKYAALSAIFTTRGPYRLAVMGDDALVIGLPMLVVAFAALLVSHSLFPDETDFRVLLALPISRRAVFLSKLLALVLFAGIFIVTANVAMTPLVVSMSIGKWTEQRLPVRLVAYWLASLGASAFVVLALTAINGVLLTCVPRARCRRRRRPAGACCCSGSCCRCRWRRGSRRSGRSSLANRGCCIWSRRSGSSAPSASCWERRRRTSNASRRLRPSRSSRR